MDKNWRQTGQEDLVERQGRGEGGPNLGVNREMERKCTGSRGIHYVELT